MDIFKLQGSLLSLPFEQTIRIHKTRQPPPTVEETSVRHVAADEGIQICLLVVTCRQGDLELLMFSYSKNNKVVNVSTKKHSHKEHITDLHIYIKHYQIKYSTILMYTYHISSDSDHISGAGLTTSKQLSGGHTLRSNTHNFDS